MTTLSSRLLSSLLALTFFALMAEGNAQTPQASKASTRLITLGTRSGPFPTVGRAQSSNLLIVNGVPYLVDAGDGVTRRLAKAGIRIRDIDNIFITHNHDDHNGGLASLLSVEYDLGRSKPINIFGPPPTEAMTKAVARYLSISSDIKISDGTRTSPIAELLVGHDAGTGVIYQDKNVKVTAAENSHFHFPPGSPAYGKAKSYSYRFDAADRVVVFTGDTGPSESVATLAKGADILVSEVTSVDEAREQRIKSGVWQNMSPEEQAGFIRHMSEEHLVPEDVGKIASQANVKAVVLTHLPSTTDPKDDYKRYGEQVKKYFSGEVLIAKDLMEF